MVTVGVATTVAPVEALRLTDGDQLYVVAPEAVRDVPMFPDGGVTVTVGVGVTLSAPTDDIDDKDDVAHVVVHQ